MGRSVQTNETAASSNGRARSHFGSRIGFILSAAGASVGLGNIWRFPYLAAEYGGGIFLLVYFILAATFGYTMVMSETALGRMTRKSPVGAYRTFGDGRFFRFGGWVNAIVPMIIVPYYSVIGGWVVRYFLAFASGQGKASAADSFFGSFTADPLQEMVCFLIFAFLTLLIIYFGVQNGIERVSKVMMPLLVILEVLISIYSMTRPGALAGVRYFLVPDFSKFSILTVVSAMEQMFYSLSIAMGILYTFGSYMLKETNLESASVQVEIFDTLVAILAGLMIIPAVFAFSGGTPESLSAGPSLLFLTMPKVFEGMAGGGVTGTLFFLLVFVAALTSSIALAESAVSTVEDELLWGRKASIVLVGAVMLLLGSLSLFGFNILSGVKLLGMDFLDFFDFISNSVMMPVGAMCTCILVLRAVGLPGIEREVESSSPFCGKKIYAFVLRYLSIVFLGVILVTSILSVLGIVKI